MRPNRRVQGGVQWWLGRGPRRGAHEVHDVIPAVFALDVEHRGWPIDADDAEGALGPMAELAALLVEVVLEGKPADFLSGRLGPDARMVVALVPMLRGREGLPDPWDQAY